MSTRVYPVNNNIVHKLYRKIPYEDLLILLRKDEAAFLEHPDNGKLTRQTVHRAARSLSNTLGRKVGYSEAIMQVGRRKIEGFILEVSKDTS